MKAKSEQTKEALIAKTDSNDGETSKEPAIKFKNYKPYDNKLIVKEKKDLTIETEKEKEKEENIKREELDIIKRELAQHNDEELNIVPKKPNWDLKSQIEERMNKLKRKTQRAIVDILREKLAEASDDEIEDNVIE
jgi:coiled-coil domain-containing protein 12